MFYDDEVILTFDNYVVMSSQNYATNSGHDSFAINGLRVTETGLVEYNWLGSNGLYGLPYISNLNSRYCLGLNPSMPEYNQKCHIPETDTQGQISLDIPSEEIIKLGIASQSPNITMGFITTGDNDNGDCEHSAYSFNLNIQYFNK
ncbi:MAG: hypothetical protein HON90_13095, partial [Halobacteriovoraceae bacterium]|nr:hypothetical protein [Halobacteriovoraceae bacterium]